MNEDGQCGDLDISSVGSIRQAKQSQLSFRIHLYQEFLSKINFYANISKSF